MSEKVDLRSKFYGTICGAHIGSAMGAQVESWSYEKIEQTYGTLEKLHSYEHYGNGWQREPGTTEDGIERQKLMISAIMDKQDRVNAEDVKNSWIKNIKPNSAGKVSEPFEAVLLSMAKSGIPAKDIGRYCDYAGLNSFARSCHPIGLINAGDIDGAINDIMEVGQLYQTTNSRGLKWACVTGVAIAAATRPEATADQVIAAIYDNCDPDIVVREIDRELKRTAGCRDFRELRKAFDEAYNGIGMAYALSYANEVVTKAVCIFQMTGGNLYDAMIAGVNLGRDTDCIAAVAAGISGALSGHQSMPEEMIRQVDYAASANPYTNTQRTLRENADGLYEAFRTRLQKMAAYVELMDI